MDKVINTREMIRNFKEVKRMLKMGKVDEVTLSDNDGTMYTFMVKRQISPMQELIKMVKEKPFTKLERPKEDLFDL